MWRSPARNGYLCPNPIHILQRRADGLMQGIIMGSLWLTAVSCALLSALCAPESETCTLSACFAALAKRPFSWLACAENSLSFTTDVSLLPKKRCYLVF